MTPIQTQRPFSNIIARLRKVGLRPTRQRIALGRQLFENGDRHVTAELLHQESLEANVRVSLATVYNTLHQFTQAGLLREIVVDSHRSYFDTNTSDHYHFFYENQNKLEDIAPDLVHLSALPDAPEGTTIKRVEVIFRVS